MIVPPAPRQPSPSRADRRPATHLNVVTVRPGAALERPDEVATEEPMEIRLAGAGQQPVAVAVTMRTPGADFDLAVGFLHSEGLIGPGDVRSVRYCDLPADAEQQFNIVTVGIRRRLDPGAVGGRALPVGSSCGLCGTASLEDLGRRCPVVAPGPPVPASTVRALPARLREAQRVFSTTGGLHAAGLFTAAGELVTIREDVGRHNAVDKVIGHRLLDGALPLTGQVLLVSGRVSFEIVEKAALAGIGVVAAVSAPTSLAVDAARRFGVALAGFLRDDRFNVYAGRDRIDLDR